MCAVRKNVCGDWDDFRWQSGSDISVKIGLVDHRDDWVVEH